MFIFLVYRIYFISDVHFPRLGVVIKSYSKSRVGVWVTMYLCILKCHTNKSLGYPQVLQRFCTIFDNNNNSYYESCEWLLGFCLLPWIFQFSGSVRTQLHHYSLDDDAVFDLFVAMCQKMLSWDDELLMLTFYLCTFKHMHTYLELG